MDIDLHASFQKRIDSLQSRLNEKTMEIADLRTKIVRNGTIPSNGDTGEHLHLVFKNDYHNISLLSLHSTINVHYYKIS